MLTNNPFNELTWIFPIEAMKPFVVIMVVLVLAGTIFDVIHKKSAKYFFKNMKKSKSDSTRDVGGGEKIKIACATAAHDVLASGEFCNHRRRIAHLLTMYGFILFLLTTAIMVFGYSESGTNTPVVYPLLWHFGALMVCVGGYWFWFFIRADVVAEGNSRFRFMPADLFVVSLLACTTFALIWSFLLSIGADWLAFLAFLLFIASAVILFGGVPWSKFAHMFFKPAAAFQNRLADADGSRSNLPPPVDSEAKFGLGIKREMPRHY